MEKVLEIQQDELHLSLFRGFVVVSRDNAELGRVPLDEIGSVILTSPQCTISKNILATLADHNIPVVICGKNYMPISMCLPISSHFQSTAVLNQQIQTTAPLKKQVWKHIIQKKITHQSNVLAKYGHTQHANRLSQMVTEVTSGDSKNHEAQSARLYWQCLMGKEFRRRPENEDVINGLLNYGYAIIRACTARHICATGLLPALGVHHHNQNNPFCLVDDVMEPYRPIIDDHVASLGQGVAEITPEIKLQMAGLLNLDLTGPKGKSPLHQCISYTAQSLKNSYLEKKDSLFIAEYK